ncbi:hypothetical protein N5D03_09505 [Empedobacter sp. GD03861]|uniref:hypothetical protein n=1 Tax=Empedobacter sp. GD03861 TaxID=2975390 RepID=UPI00244BE14F|nr:hypothetical protein [Empedobacter sp. GD03861]MDH0674779.1 hypothetical protein [Empedobacter sp. GD03861]
MEIPKDWKKVKLGGIDSEVGGIITPNNDTLIYNYGLLASSDYNFSSEITDTIFTTILKKNPDLELEKISELYINKLHKTNIDSIVQSKYQISYIVIDQQKAKLIQSNPHKLIAVYMDTIKNSTSKFNFIGYNLDEKSQEEFINSVKTIKFKK